MKKELWMMFFSLSCYAEVVNATNAQTSFLDFMKNVFKASSELVSHQSSKEQAKNNLIAENTTQQTHSSQANSSEQFQEQGSEVIKAFKLIEIDNYPPAIKILEDVLKNNPNNKIALITLVQAQFFQGNNQEALKLLSIYKSKYGEDDIYLREKARYFTITGEEDKSLAILDALLKKNPTDDKLLDLKRDTLVRKASKGKPENVPTSKPEIVTTPDVTKQNIDLVSADEAVSNKKYEKAEIIYRKYIVNHPQEKTVYISLIKVTLWQEKYSRAQKLLTNYKNKFGEDDAYLTEKARYYALNNHPDKAMAILKPLLKNDPTNETLLDIKQYALTHPKVTARNATPVTISPAESAAKLARLAESVQNNADLYAKAAEAYYGADFLRQAMIMINKALVLSPNHYQYLLLKGKIAYALDDKLVAYCTYQLLYEMNCNDPEVILGFARAAERMNKLDESAMLYWRYISLRPFEREPWIAYAYVQSWRGNDRLAIWALNRYESLFGSSQDYLVARARMVASADRPTQALSIICPLLPIIPNNYDLNYANTLALFYNNEPIEMIESLRKVNQLQPNTDETNSLNEFVLTPYRSNLSLDGYHSNDTDSIHINKLILSGQYFISPVTSILANISTERLSASIASGLEPINGGHGLWVKRLNVGVNHRLNPLLALQGLIGDASATEGGGNKLIYEGDAFITPSETFDVNLQIKRDFYDESARTVSLGITRILNQAQFFWQPCIQCYVYGNTSYSFFSDDNKETYEEINPAIQIIGSDKLNLQIGVDGTWYQFAKRKNNGYYDPLRYRYYGFVTNAYFKKNDNVGFELSVGFGTQKDETFDAYTPANDYSARGYFGIYQDWYVVLSAAMSTRGRPIAENVSSNSTYRVYAFDATITRRFW